MEVTRMDVDGVPGENLHVPRREFGAVWAATESEQVRRAEAGVADWYVGGVVATCRWLATAVVRQADGRVRPARAPVTRHTRMATPELVEVECLAAERLDMQRPAPEWLAERAGWSAGILATFAWAWRGTAGPPVEVAGSGRG